MPTPPEGTQTFTDVPTGYTFYRYIEYVAQQKVAAGFGDGSYQPGWVVNRGQMAAFIARSMEPIAERPNLPNYTPPETPSFPDVDPDFTFYKAIEYVNEHGVTHGF